MQRVPAVRKATVFPRGDLVARLNIRRLMCWIRWFDAFEGFFSFGIWSIWNQSVKILFRKVENIIFLKCCTILWGKFQILKWPRTTTYTGLWYEVLAKSYVGILTGNAQLGAKSWSWLLREKLGARCLFDCANWNPHFSNAWCKKQDHVRYSNEN